MQPTLSNIDHDRFGIVTAKATIDDGQSVPDVLIKCSELGAELSIIRVPTKNHEQIAQLEASGAFLSDTLVYTRNKLIAPIDAGLPVGYKIRLANEGDAEAVAQVASTAFSGYDGHYHNDPRLRREDADQVYVSWAHACCANRNVADAVMVAENDQEIVAFGALRKIDDATLDGVLFAVDPTHQKKGLLSALLSASIDWGIRGGFAAMEYSTHLTNIAALNAVIKLGFRFDRSVHTFHRWSDASIIKQH